MPKEISVVKNFKISDSDNIFAILNNGILMFFFVLKYIFIFILLMVGLLTLNKLRGIYLHERLNKIDEGENKLKKPRLILGTTYLFLAIGIAFNFLIYLLIWISYFLPPPLIFQLLDVVNQDYYDLDKIKNPNQCEYEFERFIYLLFALASFEACLHLILTIWYLVNNNRNISNPRKAIYNLTWSLSISIIFGFLTFAPYFLRITW
jgi:hypothetical protein